MPGKFLKEFKIIILPKIHDFNINRGAAQVSNFSFIVKKMAYK